MNPYTYKSRKAARAAAGSGSVLPGLPSAPVLEQSGLLSSVLSASINPVLALSLVGFLAVFVAGLTAVANRDIIAAAGLGEEVLTQSTNARPAVLGVASYGYNQPVCGYNTANCLNHQLIGFYNGGWQVRIDYQLTGSIVGAIRVNGWPFMDNISGSGSGYTGYDLLPGKTYTFILYKKVGTYLTKLTSLSLTAPPAPIPQPVPEPPSYGYQTVSVGTMPSHSWREGWIDMTDWGSTVEPGSVTLSGWAFDAGNNVSVNMYLRDANTGRSYRHNSLEVYTTHFRQDVLAYINRRLGITAGSAYGIYYFKARFTDLPRGNYYIQDARYNNYLFNVHSRAYQPIYVSPPPYGYYNPPAPLILPDLEIRGVRETATANLLEITLCMNGSKSINDLKRENANISNYPFSYVVYGQNGLKHERVMNAVGSIEDLKNGQCLALATSIQPDDVQYWQETKKIVYIVDPYNYIVESNESNNQYAYQGGVVPQPTQTLANVRLPEYGLYKGQTYRIKWDSQGVDKVYLKLRRNSVGDTVAAITDTIPNIGYFDWIVPTNLIDAYDYVVRVVGSGTSLYSDSPVLGIKAGATPVTTNYSPVNLKISGPTSVNINQNTLYTVSASDPEGDNLTYTFSWGDGSYKDNKLLSSGAVYSVYHSWPASGIYTVAVEARDTKGAAAQTSIQVKVSDVSTIVISPTQTTSSITYRYLKINTPQSNSWVAFREVAAVDGSGTTIRPVSATASSSYSNSTPNFAYDNNVNTVWNSGNYTGSIILDFGVNVTVKKIMALPANYPNPASGEHQLSISQDGVNFTPLTSFSGQYSDNVWLQYYR